MKKATALVVAAVLAVLLTNCGGTSTTESTRPVVVATRPVLATDSGDWSSKAAWSQEMGTDIGAYSETLGLVAEVYDDYVNGYYTDKQFMLLIEAAIETIDSYRNYYRGTQAPREYDEAHQLILLSWDRMVEGLELSIRAIETGNLDYLPEGLAKIEESDRIFTEASALLESYLG